MKESNLRRWKRYIKYMMEWIFCEKIRGLDFSMRQKSTKKTENGLYHGYSKTDERHLKEIFAHFDITEDDHIIDIGCGKGGVLRFLAKYIYRFGSTEC